MRRATLLVLILVFASLQPLSAQAGKTGEPGKAANCERTKDTIISRRSCRYPSLHSRHMDASVFGRGSMEVPATPASPL